MDKIEEFYIDFDDIELNETENQFIYEMAAVGYFSTLKNSGKPESPRFKVFVNGGEGNEPHFHIWDDATNGKNFHTCVCFNKIAYFHHDGKEGVLSKELKYMTKI